MPPAAAGSRIVRVLRHESETGRLHSGHRNFFLILGTTAVTCFPHSPTAMRRLREQRYFDYLVYYSRNRSPTAVTYSFPGRRPCTLGLALGSCLEKARLGACSNRLFQDTMQMLILRFQIFDLALRRAIFFEPLSSAARQIPSVAIVGNFIFAKELRH